MACAVLVVAILFRLPSLLHDGLWRDEANIFVELSAPTAHEFASRVMATDWHPPLYFVLVYAWTKLFGASELTLMLLPLIFSVATAPVVFRLGTIVESPVVGLVAALMYASAPLTIAVSTEYLYPLMGLLCTYLVYLVTRARSEELTVARWSAIAIVTVLVVYTHYLALLFVPLLILWSLGSPRGFRHALGVSAALIAGLATFAPWMPVFLGQRRIGVPYAATTTLIEKAEAFATILAQCMPAAAPLLASLLVGFVVVGAIVVGISRTMNARAAGLGGLFVFTLAAVVAANLIVSRYVSPLCGVLYVSLAAMLLQIGRSLYTVDTLHWRRWGPQVAATLAALLLVTNAAYAVLASEVPKSGIRTLAAAGTIEASALYVIAPDYLASTFYFYARPKQPEMLGFVRLNHPEIFTLQGYADDWNVPGIGDRRLSAIIQAAKHYRYLHFLVDPDASQQGRMPYGDVWLLLQRLEATYTLLGRTMYPGRFESVADYRFSTTRSYVSAVADESATSLRDRRQPSNASSTQALEPPTVMKINESKPSTREKKKQDATP